MGKSDSKKDSKKEPELDDKTKAVFVRKGYKVETLLGSGSYGEVYRGIRLSNDEACAVKIMNLTKMSERFKRKYLPRELAALMEMRHEYIIRTWDIFRANNRIYIFMEFCANGDIARYLKRHGLLSETRAGLWFEQVASGLQYLHEELFSAHRDIKIDNILLNSEWDAKLTDFGFVSDALVDDEGAIVLSKTFCGTRPYYSPQLVSQTPYNAFKTDVWAFGVVLYAMLHNKFPFHFKDGKMMLKEQYNREYKISRLRKSISKEVKDLILKMFEPTEDARLTFKQVLQHPWVLDKDKK